MIAELAELLVHPPLVIRNLNHVFEVRFCGVYVEDVAPLILEKPDDDDVVLICH